MKHPETKVQDVEHHDPVVSPAKFLVCADKGDASRVALRFACIKAKKRGGQVGILHVMEPAGFQSLPGIADKMQQERREAAESLMKELSDIAYGCDITPTLLLREGKIGDEILKTAVEDVGVNMLVLGVTPGNAGKGKLIAWLSTRMGEDLLMPIMLVPGNLTDQQIGELS